MCLPEKTYIKKIKKRRLRPGFAILRSNVSQKSENMVRCSQLQALWQVKEYRKNQEKGTFQALFAI
ncbi:hypothetical protein EO95_10185 [Methanosarcina sp. 1.H.T.1A.1]|nr:hypothetical protein EO93_09825 [Methanosarcina sp. 1.H.A.2.2]KKH96401.1 hypothetical protein EO95_10185 [Methanosarcina sp. 1.H.T.1A.1]